MAENFFIFSQLGMDTLGELHNAQEVHLSHQRLSARDRAEISGHDGTVEPTIGELLDLGHRLLTAFDGG